MVILQVIQNLKLVFHPAQAVFVPNVIERAGFRSRRDRINSALILSPVRSRACAGLPLRRVVPRLQTFNSLRNETSVCAEYRVLRTEYFKLQQQGRAASGDGMLLDRQ